MKTLRGACVGDGLEDREDFDDKNLFAKGIFAKARVGVWAICRDNAEGRPHRNIQAENNGELYGQGDDGERDN